MAYSGWPKRPIYLPCIQSPHTCPKYCPTLHSTPHTHLPQVLSRILQPDLLGRVVPVVEAVRKDRHDKEVDENR